MQQLRRLAGWLPAVILPTATFDQFWVIIWSGSSENVSVVTWTLFLLANVGALCLGRPEDKIAVSQMGLAFGLTAILDLAIVILIVTHRIAAG
jgi:hypothetical protein